MTPRAAVRAVEHAVADLALNLDDLVVYTEAGTGAFALTPALAARAGARCVYAIAKPWNGKAAGEVAKEAVALARALGVADRIVVRQDRQLDDFAAADVVTNLGFVRPIGRDVIGALKDTAAIAFMREPWEVREEDVDLQASAMRGIPVLGTNEHDPGVGVFDDCGVLGAKLLFEAGVEIAGSAIVIVSADAFGPALQSVLQRMGARITLVRDPADRRLPDMLAGADALVVADFVAKGWLVGDGGPIAPALVAEYGVPVVAFAGGVDADALRRAGVICVPGNGSRPARMGQTLAYLGPRPVARLHAAGLKVGAAAARARRQGLSGDALVQHVCRVAPAAPLIR